MESLIELVPRTAAQESGAIRVLIVDDHPVVRLGMRTMLESETDIFVNGAAASLQEAGQMIAEEAPQVVLMDLRLPGVDGVEGILELRRIRPGLRILVLTSYVSDDLVFRALQAGAMGYLLKDAHQAEIVDAIRTIDEGSKYIPAELAGKLAQAVGREALTHREVEVLALVAKGLTNKEIAFRLFISDKTARNHVVNCLSKLGVDDRTAAVMAALERGIISLDRGISSIGA